MTTLILFLSASLPAQIPIPTGFGPEDLVTDTLNNPPRILISCAGRRPEYPAFGEIQAFNPQTGIVAGLPRLNEPAGLVFRPHGISLVNTGSVRYLYVISHDDDQGIHPVIKYLVTDTSLIFKEMLTSPLLVSPNAVQAYPDGRLLVCNDAARRGSMAEKIFRLKRGNIILYDGKGKWTIVAKKLGMPAGLAGDGDQVFVNASLENKMYVFTFRNNNLTGKKKLCAIKGGDNIRIYPDFLLTTSHAKALKFIGHVGNKDKWSPSLVLKVNPVTGKITPLFADSGEQISAASAALLWRNQLVIGQIFEPFILIYQATE